jgi:hypothetical protein
LVGLGSNVPWRKHLEARASLTTLSDIFFTFSSLQFSAVASGTFALSGSFEHPSMMSNMQNNELSVGRIEFAFMADPHQVRAGLRSKVPFRNFSDAAD